jgi:hypothetical protein
MRLPSRGDVSDQVWKWRYKISNLGKSDEKTVDDFTSPIDLSAPNDSSEDGDEKAVLNSGPLSKEPILGSAACVKTFYEGPHSRDGIYNWVDYPPKQLSKSAAKAQDRVAIKVYKIKDSDRPVISGRSTLKYHMIEIQNPLLVAAVDDVLRKQDMHLDLNEIASFTAPFRPLYFAYDDLIVKYRSLAEDDQVRPFLLLLIKLLDDIFSDVRVKLKQLRAKGLVSFKLAWTFFPKDTTVISWGNNCELLCRITDTEYRQLTPGVSILNINGKVLRFNGHAFIWEDVELKIPAFAGNKPMTKMPHYPLEFHENGDEVITRLTARGKKVLDYQGLVYCGYKGVALHRNDIKIEKHNVSLLASVSVQLALTILC